MLLLYKTLVRPILEYWCVLWSPETKGEIAKLEPVQRNFTRRISGCRGMTYWDRLYHLNLQSLQRRRDRYSMIQVWKTYNNLVPNSTQMKFSEGARLVIPPYNYRAQKSKVFGRGILWSQGRSAMEYPSGKHQGFPIIGDSKRTA